MACHLLPSRAALEAQIEDRQAAKLHAKAMALARDLADDGALLWGKSIRGQVRLCNNITLKHTFPVWRPGAITSYNNHTFPVWRQGAITLYNNHTFPVWRRGANTFYNNHTFPVWRPGAIPLCTCN
jgi:hypothetical protein